MRQKPFLFQSGTDFIRSIVSPIFVTSKKYAWTKTKWEDIFCLGDRMLARCKEDPCFSELQTFEKYLYETMTTAPPLQGFAVKALLGKVEIWLKSIFKVIYPERWTEIADEKVGLYYIVNELSLLTEIENQTGVIKDPVHRFIYLARVIRNRILHDPTGLSHEWQSLLLPATMTIILAPLCIHYQTIYERLQPLIVHRFEESAGPKLVESFRLPKLDQRLQTKSLEIKVELSKYFKEKTYTEDPFFVTYQTSLERQVYKHSILTYGSELAEPVGRYVAEVREQAPWLPEFILVDGNQSDSFTDQLLVLLMQANSLLARPFTWSKVNQSFSIERGKEWVYQILEQVVRERGGAWLLLCQPEDEQKRIEWCQLWPEFFPLGIKTIYLVEKKSDVQKWLTKHRTVERLLLPSVEENLDSLEPRISRADDYVNQELQMLLSAFAPVSDLSSEVIQAYLHWRGIMIDQPDLLAILSKLQGVQVDGQQVKSNLEIDHFLQEAQIGDLLIQLLAWLRQLDQQLEQDVQSPLLYQFLQYWMQRESFYPLLTTWLEQMVSSGEIELIYQTVRKGWMLHGTFSPLGTVALKMTSLTGHYPSICLLADYLLSLDDSKQQQEGETWLRQAAQEGYLPAVKRLGRYLLISGRSEGERWLLQAIEKGDWEGACLLGLSYLEKNRAAEGERWLRKAAEQNFQQAMFELGQLLIDEGMDLRRVKEGTSWIRQGKILVYLEGLTWGETKDSSYRLTKLSLRFLEEKGLFRDQRLGEMMLQKAMEMGCTTAMSEWGKRSLLGAGLPRKVEEGRRWVKIAIKHGNSQAMTYWGEILLCGNGSVDELTEGVFWLEQASKKENTLAMRILGKHYLHGTILPQDVFLAIKWLKQAADLGDAEAMCELGKYYLTKKEIEKGITFLEDAANNGSRPAAFELGVRYLKGKDLPKNAALARKWLIRAAQQNDPQAIDMLVLRLLDGKGLVKDEREAKRWIGKALVFEQKNIIRTLGLYYIRGKGVKKNINEAKCLLEQAALLGDKQACIELGERLIDGTDFVASPKEGQKWLEHAVYLGSSQAMVLLAERLLYGKGLAANTKEGIKWLRQAAQYGDQNAMVALAKYFLYGGEKGGRDPQKIEEAKYWLQQAARDGGVEAVKLLNKFQMECLEQTKEIHMLEQAAKAGNVKAMIELGRRYLKGDGLPMDVEKGEYWLTQAQIMI
jgi:TPR repeat protein